MVSIAGKPVFLHYRSTDHKVNFNLKLGNLFSPLFLTTDQFPLSHKDDPDMSTGLSTTQLLCSPYSPLCLTTY